MTTPVQNCPLQPYHTFGIAATAARLVELTSEDDIRELMRQGAFRQPYLVLGKGSNVVFTADYPGLVLVMRTRGISATPDGEGHILVTAAAGEEWDPFVRHCAREGWHGLENLAAIPGTVGASAVQNVGAYGAEAQQFIHCVNTIDLASGASRQFTREECRFAYRYSIFKEPAMRSHLITSVVYRLSTTFTPDTSYKALQDYFHAQQITGPTPLQFVEALTDLRWSKLPRPEDTGSAGSFFKNPIVSPDVHQRLKARFPQLVSFPAGEGFKLAAGWLIDQCGWKGRTLGHCGVYAKQALVLVNHGGATGEEVLALAQSVIRSVEETFGVTLEPEAILV